MKTQQQFAKQISPVYLEKLIARIWPGGKVEVTKARPVHPWGSYDDDISEIIAGLHPFLYNHQIPGTGRITVLSVITEMIVAHPESPIKLTYGLGLEPLSIGIKNMDWGPGGTESATEADITLIGPIVRRIHDGWDMTQPTTVDYDATFERLQAGEDYETVRAEFMQLYNISSGGFRTAMYRRRHA